MTAFRGASIALCAVLVAASPRLIGIPDAARTPGAVESVDRAAVCAPGFAHRARHVPYRVRDAIYTAYGIPRGHRIAGDTYEGPRRDYVIDHLVPLELGGANDARNLWPQPRARAKEKDRVEDALHELVCTGQMDLGDAQRRIERDWQHAVPAVSRSSPRE